MIISREEGKTFDKIQHPFMMKVKVAQSCPTLCDPRGYAIHEVLKARMLEWAAFPFSRGSSQPKNQIKSPALQVYSLPVEPSGKPPFMIKKNKFKKAT